MVSVAMPPLSTTTTNTATTATTRGGKWSIFPRLLLLVKKRQIIALVVIMIFWLASNRRNRNVMLLLEKQQQSSDDKTTSTTTTTSPMESGGDDSSNTRSTTSSAYASYSYNNYEAPTSSSSSSPIMIVYISQGPASQYKRLHDRFESAFSSLPPKHKDSYRFYYHSFDEDCGDGCIFQKKTSFAQGKNLLIKAIVESEEYKNGQIKYVASIDNDVPLFLHPPSAGGGPRQEDGWKPFHELLLHPNTTHPFIKPRFSKRDMKDPGRTYQSCTDENFWVIRTDHLSAIYPHSTYKQEITWTNAIRVFYLFQRCDPAAMLVHEDFATQNPQHSYKEVSKNWSLMEVQEHAVHILQQEYAAVGPWEVRRRRPLNNRCGFTLTPSVGLDPKCKEVMDDRFQKWIDGEFEP